MIFGPRKQKRILREVRRRLLETVDRPWQKIHLYFGATHRMTVEVLVATAPDGTEFDPHSLSKPPLGISDLLRELRARMYQEETGTWFSLEYTLHSDHTFHVDYSYDTEPDFGHTIDPYTYYLDLQNYPRSADHIPTWLERVITKVEEKLEEEEEGPKSPPVKSPSEPPYPAYLRAQEELADDSSTAHPQTRRSWERALEVFFDRTLHTAATIGGGLERGEDQRLHLTAPSPEHSHTLPQDWLHAFCLSLICRDDPRSFELCDMGSDMLVHFRQDGTPNASLRSHHWIKALQAHFMENWQFDSYFNLAVELKESDTFLQQQDFGGMLLPTMRAVGALEAKNATGFTEHLTDALERFRTHNDPTLTGIHYPLAPLALACRAHDLSQHNPDFTIDLTSDLLPRGIVHNTWTSYALAPTTGEPEPIATEPTSDNSLTDHNGKPEESSTLPSQAPTTEEQNLSSEEERLAAIDEDEHDRLLYESVKRVLDRVDSPWQEIHLYFADCHRITEGEVTVTAPDGTKFHLLLPEESKELFRELRSKMHSDIYGTWLSFEYILREDYTYTVSYDYNTEPEFIYFINPYNYYMDLRTYPRAPEHTPDWLRRNFEEIEKFLQEQRANEEAPPPPPLVKDATEPPYPAYLRAQEELATDPTTSQPRTRRAWERALEVSFDRTTHTAAAAQHDLDHEPRGEHRELIASALKNTYNLSQDWLRAFHLALICRDEPRLWNLCQIASEAITYAGIHTPEPPYRSYRWVGILRAYYLQEEDFSQTFEYAFSGKDFGTGLEQNDIGQMLLPTMRAVGALEAKNATGFTEHLTDALERFRTHNDPTLTGIHYPLAPLALACRAHDLSQHNPGFTIDLTSDLLPRGIVHNTWTSYAP